MLSAALLTILMLLSFYFLLTSKQAKQVMKGKNYSYGFMLSILAFVEGVLFSIFTWELIQEQIESLEDNQTYIDDMQKVWGKPQDFLVNCEQMFGKDKMFWLIPTHPCLKINYLERLYTKH